MTTKNREEDIMNKIQQSFELDRDTLTKYILHGQYINYSTFEILNSCKSANKRFFEKVQPKKRLIIGYLLEKYNNIKSDQQREELISNELSVQMLKWLKEWQTYREIQYIDQHEDKNNSTDQAKDAPEPEKRTPYKTPNPLTHFTGNNIEEERVDIEIMRRQLVNFIKGAESRASQTPTADLDKFIDSFIAELVVMSSKFKEILALKPQQATGKEVRVILMSMFRKKITQATGDLQQTLAR